MSDLSNGQNTTSLMKQAVLALEKMQAKLDIMERAQTEPIAIIGIGCRFPGGANDPETFWRLLCEGYDAITEVPADRWDIDAFYDPDPDAPGKMNTRWGGFIDQVDQFDPHFFGMSPHEAMYLDPQQRLFLEVAWEGFEHAGQASATTLSGSETGIFAAIYQSDYSWLQLGDTTDADPYAASGNAHGMMANRLSFILNLRGPSLVVDTACSSSLVAVHLACQALRNRECTLALAGGVNLVLSPLSTVALSKWGAMAADGRCKAFDARADGFVRGEGCGVVVLKRLSDALSAGDSVLALIRGSAVNQDGRSSVFTAPNGLAQEAVVQQALRAAQVKPEQIDYVEAHGTGTALGDPIEVEALSAALGAGRPAEQPLWVGSVKTNIGHLEAAAGIAGLLKTVLALQHERIPPHLHLREPSPHIDWQHSPVRIPTHAVPWPAQPDRCRSAGVSSFGMGGTNAHVVLQEAPPPVPEPPTAERPWHLLTLSAKSPGSLEALAGRYAAALEASASATAVQVCASANQGRNAFPQRLAVLGRDRQELAQRLRGAGQEEAVGVQRGRAGKRGPRVALLFTGQGSQYAGMGQQIGESEPLVQEILARCEAAVADILEVPLRQVLWGPHSALLEQTRYTQPALVALEYALAELWRRWGVEPSLLLGHSVGEYSAAMVAGILSVEEGMRLVAWRGALMQQVQPAGTMLAVQASAQEAEQVVREVGGCLRVAAYNGQESQVLSGRVEEVEQAQEKLEQRGRRTRKMQVSQAFHSPVLDPMLEEWEAEVRQVRYGRGQIELVSNVRGEIAQEGEMEAGEYWLRQVSAPVQFARGVRALKQAGIEVVIEVGPQPALLGLVQQEWGEQEVLGIASLRRDQQDWEHLLEGVGQLYVRGMEWKWERIEGAAAGRRVVLPTYPFDRQRYWIETDTSHLLEGKIGRASAAIPRDEWFYQVVWHKQPLLYTNRAVPAGTWLILKVDGSTENDTYAQKMIHYLAEHHGRGVPVNMGQRDDVQQALQTAHEDEHMPLRNVLLCCNTPSSAIVWEEVLQLCSLTLTLVQSLVGRSGSRKGHAPPRLWILTRGVHQVGEGEQTQPSEAALGQAALWGLGRVIALEHPDIWGGLIDLPVDAATEQITDSVIKEIRNGRGKKSQEQHANAQEDQVVLRAEQRYVARLRRRPDMVSVDVPIVQAEGTYLITGGLGGLGLQVAHMLVERGAKHLVLVSRHEPGSEQASSVQELRAAGAQIVLLAADVALESEVARILITIQNEQLPPLRGVIHAAGVLEDGVLLQQSAERFAYALAPKVAGAWHLHQQTQLLPLDWFVLFSSVASVMGSPGQGPYAAANAFLDALAQYRHAKNLPGLSINWGPWADVGMAARQTERGKHKAQYGIENIPAEQGCAVLEGLLREQMAGTRNGQIAVLPIHWERFLREQAIRNDPALLIDIINQLRQNGTVSEEEFSKATLGRAGTADLLILLERALPNERYEVVLTYVLKQVMKVLRLDASHALQAQQGLFDSGMDSLTAIQLRNILQESIGETYTLPSTLIFDHPTVEALATYLNEHLSNIKMSNVQPAPFTSTQEPIAIIGLACRFPDGANDPETFWRYLCEGHDAITPVPGDRWDVQALYDPDPAAPGKMTTQWGGFISQVDQFDPYFFGISPREVISMDPQQRILLETSWEALERAGQVPDTLVGSKTGVFIGISSHDYMQLYMKSGDPSRIDAYLGTGGSLSAAAGRLSYVFGLQGPSMAIDTACSSSLVATHLACESLLKGNCNLALVGGVNLILTPESTIYFSRLGAMAVDGRCKTFDARADGYVRGEGCGVVVLKRLSDAQAAGDPILALIRGSAVNQDGRSAGLTVPNGLAQETVIRDALVAAQLEPEQIGYVEAHGTGTSLGDPIELRALGEVLSKGRPGDRPFYVGSVKTNIGHLEAAAGIAGLIKTVLILQHKEIPPHLHFKEPSPLIAWNEIPVAVPTTCVSWSSLPEQARYAGVSAFGFVGTNAHIVLEEAPLSQVILEDTDQGQQEARSMHLLSLSARSPQALQSLVQSYITWLDEHKDANLYDVCATANLCRSHHAYRLVLTGKSLHALTEQAQTFLQSERLQKLFSADRKRKIVFVCSGQGSQWEGMGQRLLEQEPVFRQQMERCEQALRAHVDWSLLEVLRRGEPWQDIALIQPVLFSLQVSLAALWRGWGVEPGAVVGHSLGEVAAACIAGSLSLEEGARIICERSRLLRRVSNGGAMLLVEQSQEQAQAWVRGREKQVAVAVSNSARATVLAGERAALAEIEQEVQRQGIFCRWLKVDVAAHSPQVEGLREELAEALRGLVPAAGEVAFYSTVRGQRLRGEELDAAYWVSNLREPVQFGRTVQGLLSEGYDTFVELSPHPLLTSSIRETVELFRQTEQWAQGREYVVIGSLHRAEDEYEILRRLGMLYTYGVTVDWTKLYPRKGQCLNLPTYPFERQRYWVDNSERETPKQRSVPRPPQLHPLLGKMLKSPLVRETVFETVFSIEMLPFLRDHIAYGEVVVPGACHIAMMLEAAVRAFGEGIYSIKHVMFPQALVISHQDTQTVQLVLTPEEANIEKVQVISIQEGGDYIVHAQGMLHKNEHERNLSEVSYKEIQKRCQEEIPDAALLYAAASSGGLQLGPRFRWLGPIWLGHEESLCEMHVPPEVHDASAYRLHPGLIDSCFQLLGVGSLMHEGSEYVYAPLGFDALRLYIVPTGRIWVHARLQPVKEGQQEAFTGHITLFNDAGTIFAEIEQVYVKRAPREMLLRSLHPRTDEWLYTIDWQLCPHEASSSAHKAIPGTWLIFTQAGTDGEALADMLWQRGERSILVQAGESYGMITETRYQVHPEHPDEFRRLLEDVLNENERLCRGIVYMWGLDDQQAESPLYSPLEMQRNICGGALHIIQAVMAQEGLILPHVWFITQGAQCVQERDTVLALHQAPLWGLGKVVALEHPDLHCTLIDRDPLTPENAARELFAEIWSGDQADHIALRQGARYIARLIQHRPRLQSSEALSHSAGRSDEPERLEISTRGILDNLVFRPMKRSQPGPEEVEIQVYAAGLNFRDVLNALDMYPGDAGPLGGECAGKVVAVGTGIDSFAVGDEVVALAPASFSTFTTTSSLLVGHKPENLSYEEAAAIPTSFLTVYYSLLHLAGLKAGDRILIHAAAGGVGMAAVQIARRVGAEVFATASPGKWEFLHSLGIQHIMNSRTLTFADEIMELTGGQGVDVVLNSLTGEFIPRSLAVLRHNGRLIEIGKRGILTASQVATYRQDVEYHIVTLDQMAVENPDFVGTMLRELLEEFKKGLLQPLPGQVVPFKEAPGAFRRMAQAKHIGKIVFSMRERSPESQPGERVAVRSDGTYLITGGLGGLGLQVASWLTKCGARHLVLVSRHQPDTDQAAILQELRRHGVEVLVLAADIAREADVTDIMTSIHDAGLPPLRGVLHAAGVLDDGIVLQQNVERFLRVMAPKIAGAWYLHQHTLGAQLDWFVLFSSAASLLGSPGQGNYAAANMFLDVLAQHRRTLGLPALSINWGPWTQVGLASQAKRDERMAQHGIPGIAPEQGLAVLEQLLNEQMAGTIGAQVAVLPVEWRVFLQQFTSGEEPSLLAEIARKVRDVTPATQQDASIIQRIMEAPASRRRKLLLASVREQAVKVLGMDPSRHFDPQQPLNELGLDSLMAVELRNLLSSLVGTTLSATLLFNYPTIQALVDYLATDILSLHDAPVVEDNAQGETSNWHQLEETVAELSVNDVNDLLREELATIDELMEGL